MYDLCNGKGTKVESFLKRFENLHLNEFLLEFYSDLFSHLLEKKCILKGEFV